MDRSCHFINIKSFVLKSFIHTIDPSLIRVLNELSVVCIKRTWSVHIKGLFLGEIVRDLLIFLPKSH